MNLFSKINLAAALACAVSLLSLTQIQAQPDPKYGIHDRSRPTPQHIEAGYPGTQDMAGKAPSDATILFDGTNLDKWVGSNNQPSKWIIKDGAMECTPGSGSIYTKDSYGDCHLHVEWASPAKVEGSDQGRGNSGVLFSAERYEVQILDTYNNSTYADGYAGALYGQYPPSVNPIHKPGEWNNYDIIYIAPRFNEDGSLKSPARVTVLFNGVLVQWDRKLTGSTVTNEPYKQHDLRLPISLQDHGNPVRFRNIWIREIN